MAGKGLAVVGHIGPVSAGDTLSAPHALSAFAALGQATRLEIFRLLMRNAPKGLIAGVIAEQVGCAPTTLSSHLSILARAGLIRGTRDGRAIHYSADVEGMRALVAFMITDCCDGHPEICNFLEAPADSACGCGPAAGCALPPKPARRRR
jgi:ArsR family transcriptional regulator, arsenate/arsenite/antimonite-responsive transcriptional repressor